MSLSMGIIGLRHDHLWWYLDHIRRVPKARITCVADPSPTQLDKARAVPGMEDVTVYEDEDRMLAEEKIDACLVFSENYRHAELTEKCARRGVHVMVEKPIAGSLADADRMLNAVEEHKVRLMVNYPIYHMPYVNSCYKVVKDGSIGRVWSFRFVTGHSGPEAFCSNAFTSWLLDKDKNQGGSLQDFCTYGACLFVWYFGRPDRVSAMSGKFIHTDYPAEDHAVITVRYDRLNVIGTIEGTWATTPDILIVRLSGEKGSVFNDPRDVQKLYIQAAGEKEARELPQTQMPDWQSVPINYFVERLHEGKPFEGMTDPQVARDAQEILDAAKRSVIERREVELPKR